ncbi:PAS domain-containing protein [candidate division KSB1 bacterium]|nr:PAS domain-containing protein [candidate division KSB1 bacterium]
MQQTALLTDYIDDSILVHLQNSFAQQNRVNVCFLDTKGQFLLDPSEYIEIPSDNSIFFQLLRPQKDFEKLGLEDGRYIFASFLRGRFSRVLIPIIYQDTFWGAIAILKLNTPYDGYMKRVFELLQSRQEHLDHLFDPVAIHLDRHLFLLATQFLEKIVQQLKAGWGRSKIESKQNKEKDSFENFAIIRTTADGNIIFVNDHALKLLKFDSKDELVGTNVMDTVIYQSQEIAPLKQGDENGQEKILLECKDGSTLSVWVRIYGQNDLKGEHIGFEYHFETIHDPVESYQIAPGDDEEFDIQTLFNELEHNKTLPNTAKPIDSQLDIYQGAPDPIFIIDQHGYIQLWNFKAEQVTGLSEKSMSGKDFGDFLSDVQGEQWHEWLMRLKENDLNSLTAPDAVELTLSNRTPMLLQLYFAKDKSLGEDYILIKILHAQSEGLIRETAKPVKVLAAQDVMLITDVRGKIVKQVIKPFFASGETLFLLGEIIPHWCKVPDRQRLKQAMQKASEGQDQQLDITIKPFDELIRSRLTIKKVGTDNQLGWTFADLSADVLDARSLESIWTSQDTWLLEFSDELELEKELNASEHPSLIDMAKQKDFRQLCLAVSEYHQVKIYWPSENDRLPKNFCVIFPFMKLGKKAGVRGVVLELPHRSADSTARYRLFNVVQAIARVSQEYENQLMTIRDLLAQLSTDTDLHPRHKRQIYEIHSGLESLQNYNQRLVDLDPQGCSEFRLVDLKLLLNELISSQQMLFGNEITYNIEFSGPCLVNGDFAQLYRAFDYLFKNAQQAMPEGGCVDVQIYPYEPDANTSPILNLAAKHIVIQIKDHGTGIEPSVLGRIFEPFFSTHPDHHSGLGLAAVYAIVKRHGGYIDVSSSTGRGTIFSIYFQQAETIQEEENQKMSETHTVLLIDDEKDILEINGLMLKQFGYQVIRAANAKEALKKFRAHKDEIDIAIVDALLPDLPGTECAEELLSMSPNLSIIFSSGNQCSAPYQKIIDRTGGAWLQKPYGGAVLNKTVKKVLERKA